MKLETKLGVAGLVFTVVATILAALSYYYAKLTYDSTAGEVEVNFIDFAIGRNTSCSVPVNLKYQIVNYSNFDRIIRNIEFIESGRAVPTEINIDTNRKIFSEYNRFSEKIDFLNIPAKKSVNIAVGVSMELTCNGNDAPSHILPDLGNTDDDEFWQSVSAAEAVQKIWVEAFEPWIKSNIKDYDPNFDRIVIDAFRGCPEDVLILPSICGNLEMVMESTEKVISESMSIAFVPYYLKGGEIGTLIDRIDSNHARKNSR